MGVNKENQQKASGDLEDLEPVLKEIVSQLRMGVADDLAYALVYRFRREIGYVVASLGSGVPNTAYNNRAEEIIESQKWQPRTTN